MFILISRIILGPIIGPSDGLGVLVPFYRVFSSILKASYIISSLLARCSIVALV
jgi:hypothetical protein